MAAVRAISLACEAQFFQNPHASDGAANRAIKAHFCDRHHIAIAMAELPSQLSIGAARAVLTFDVPPKHSAPLTRGFFFVRGGNSQSHSFARRAQDTLEPNLYMIRPLVDQLR
jgi:hypothetical protein